MDHQHCPSPFNKPDILKEAPRTHRCSTSPLKFGKWPWKMYVNVLEEYSCGNYRDCVQFIYFFLNVQSAFIISTTGQRKLNVYTNHVRELIVAFWGLRKNKTNKKNVIFGKSFMGINLFRSTNLHKTTVTPPLKALHFFACPHPFLSCQENFNGQTFPVQGGRKCA